MTVDTAEDFIQVWADRPELGEGPPGYVEMVEALRVLQDRVAVADPPPSLIADVTRAATELSSRLAAYAVPERDRIAGRLSDVPGRGQTLVPPVHLGPTVDGRITGHVTFTDIYLGANDAVHGGTIPLMFDEVLGRLSITDGRTPSRTAYLHVDYRSVTPLNTRLRIEVWFEREEGRKRFLRGVLYSGSTLCVEVSGLFVALRPGQP
jgi:hypothetical protein